MDATLAWLLSNHFDNSLAPEHRADCKQKSGLSDETIHAAGLRSVPIALLPKLLRFNVPGVVSAMLIPFRSSARGFMDHRRVRVYPELRDRAGHSIKYLQPKGSSSRLYFAPMTMCEVLEGDAPLWLIEGEKKSLAVAQLGLPAVGFCGIEGWHRAGSVELLPDFDAIPLRDRVVELVADGDWRTNPAVARGVHRFGDALAARGARPRLVVLPERLPA